MMICRKTTLLLVLAIANARGAIAARTLQVCNVCPDGEEITNPDTVIALAEGMTCQEIVAAGLAGQIPGDLCAQISAIAGDCGCEAVSGGGDGIPTEAPAAAPGMGGDGDMTEAPIAAATEAPVAAPTDSGAGGGDGGSAGLYDVCELCGAGSAVTIPDGVLPTGNTCAEAEQAGLGGYIPPDNCTQIEAARDLVINDVCGCEETDGSGPGDVPTMTPPGNMMGDAPSSVPVDMGSPPFPTFSPNDISAAASRWSMVAIGGGTGVVATVLALII